MALGYVVQQRQERSRRRVEEDFRSQDLIRQRMERRLQHSEDQMAMAIDAAKIGFFEWDCIGNKHMWSNRIRPLLGISPEAPANFEGLMAAVHPDDRQLCSDPSPGSRLTILNSHWSTVLARRTAACIGYG